MRVTILSLLTIVAVVCSESAFITKAQNASGSISGRVADQRGDSISGAQIILTSPGGNKPVTRTDDRGEYRLELPPGEHELRVEAKGFSSTSQRVTVIADTTTSVAWLMEVEQVPEVVTVTAARVERRLDELTANVTVLTNNDVKHAAAQTIDDLLRQVPGFSIFRRSSSLVANPTTQGVSLRGAGASGASRTLVLTDGLPLNDAFGGWVYWDRVSRSAIEQVEVVRGGSSDLYGSDALSGVINLITRSPSFPVVDAEVSYGNRGTADFNFFAGGVWHNWSVAASGEAFKTDGYFIVAPEQRGPVDEHAASEHRVLTVRVARNFGTATKPDSSIFVRGSLFDEDRKNGTPLQRNDTTTESVATGFRFATKDWGTTQFSLFGNQQRFHQSFTGVVAGRASENLTREQAVPSHDGGFSLSWSRLLASRHLVIAGADVRGVTGSSDELIYIAGAPATFVSAGGRQRRLGFYAQDLISITSRAQLSLSARYDRWRDFSAYSIERAIATGIVRPRFFPERTEDALSPRLAFLFHFNEQFALRAAAYQAFRAPTLNELYRSFRAGDTLTLPNERLEAERLTGGEGGMSFQMGDRVRSRLTGYWTETVNPITNFTLSVTPALITRERRNLGRTRSAGIEAEADFKVADHWSLTAGYLYSATKVLEAPQDARLVGAWIPQVPRHQFTLQTVYSNPRYLTASLQFRASGKQFDDDRNLFVLDSFALIDLLAERRLARNVSLFFAVQNVLNERYVVGRTPIETIGMPRLFRGGVRVNFGN